MRKKGISAVIATILMLMITIALAGLAYMYISGIFTARTATAISLASIDCTDLDIYALVKNDGTASINLVDIDIYVDGGSANNCAASGTVAAGRVATCAVIANVGAGTHSVRIVGPSNAITGSVYCA